MNKYIIKRFSAVGDLVIAGILGVASYLLGKFVVNLFKPSTKKLSSNLPKESPKSTCKSVDDLRAKYTDIPSSVWDTYEKLIYISDRWVQVFPKRDFDTFTEGSIDTAISSGKYNYFWMCYIGLNDMEHLIGYDISLKSYCLLEVSTGLSMSSKKGEESVRSFFLCYVDSLLEAARNTPRLKAQISQNKKIILESGLGSTTKRFSIKNLERKLALGSKIVVPVAVGYYTGDRDASNDLKRGKDKNDILHDASLEGAVRGGISSVATGFLPGSKFDGSDIIYGSAAGSLASNVAARRRIKKSLKKD